MNRFERAVASGAYNERHNRAGRGRNIESAVRVELGLADADVDANAVIVAPRSR